MKLRVKDTVKVVKGKDKGKTGSIEKVFPQDESVLILGVNQYKRHMKSRSKNQRSEIVTITKPLPVANVSLVCPKCSKVTRIGFTYVNEKKVRVCKKCEQEI